MSLFFSGISLGGQPRGQTAVSYSSPDVRPYCLLEGVKASFGLFILALEQGAVSHGVKPRSPSLGKDAIINFVEVYADPYYTVLVGGSRVVVDVLVQRLDARRC